MTFSVSTPNLINLIFIAMGVGICGLTLLQVSSAAHLRIEVKRYFQIFFGMLILYITTHLARQLMEGLPGGGIRTALVIVTFVEVLAAGFMAYMMSIMVLYIARRENPSKPLELVLLGLMAVHAVLLIADLFGDFIYYYDAENVYHRAPLYVTSNLCPLIMLVIDVVLLIRYRDSFEPRIKSAFWTYMIAPIAAIIIQSFTYGVQLIIFATVGAAVYMFLVIIRKQNEEYEKQQSESSRIETELSLATRIQADMLPNIFPAFPERDEFDIYASMTPAKEVGGDFYDFFFVDDDHLVMVMADVSGKGVPAAMFMMISKTLTQNYAITGRSPKEVLEIVNAQICANNKEKMFVTMWLGVLDIKTGIITAANAGHEYPVLKAADGSFELVRDKHGLVIGAYPGMRYTEYTMQLDPGAKLFIYTDGVPEATNEEEELFGNDRMVEALRTAENGTPREVLAAVDGAVAAFVKDAPQFDDLTMLCLQYKGKQQQADRPRKIN